MSNTSSPTDSPVILPMHNPAQAAIVQQPLAPVGNITHGLFQAPGQATKAMLAKRLAAKGGNPKYISPTDKMMTPCTAKITQSKKKRFNKGSKPVQLFSPPVGDDDEDADAEDTRLTEETVEGTTLTAAHEEKVEAAVPESDAMVIEDENPFDSG